mgnify:CR=1 FL=1
MGANVARRLGAPSTAQRRRKSWIAGKCCLRAAPPPSRRSRAVRHRVGAGSAGAPAAHRVRGRPADAADRRHERDVPGAAHLLHRPQLRRACARDGLRPEPRAAVLLPEAERRDPVRRRPARPPTIPYPPLTKNYHYEIELVAALGKGGSNVPVEQALELVYGYTIGLDMTRRDLQRAMGDEKKPWEIGKSFDRSAPMGPLHRVADVGHFTKGAIYAQGQRRRSSRTPTST